MEEENDVEKGKKEEVQSKKRGRRGRFGRRIGQRVEGDQAKEVVVFKGEGEKGGQVKMKSSEGDGRLEGL